MHRRHRPPLVCPPVLTILKQRTHLTLSREFRNQGQNDDVASEGPYSARRRSSISSRKLASLYHYPCGQTSSEHRHVFRISIVPRAVLMNDCWASQRRRAWS